MEEDCQKKNHGCKHVTPTKVDYDALLSSAGEFGRFQYLLFFASFPFYIFGVFVYFAQMFMTETSPNHWCWVPELQHLTDIERRSLAIPVDENSRFGYSRCSVYAANWSEVLATGNKPNQSWPTMSCSHGWEFNKTEIPYDTISSELGWVCERDSYQASAQSIFFVGSIVGGFVLGYISDAYGRLPAIVFSNMISCIAGIGSTYAPSFIVFAICRFFVGMGYDNCMMMMYLLTLEFIAPKYRTISTNLPFALFFTTGLVSLPWIAIACNNWKTLSLATSIPLALAVLTYFTIPESPRWLLSKCRVDETIEKVKYIGKVNKKEVSPELIQKFKTSYSQQPKEESYTVLELVKRPLLRRMFFFVCLEYMCAMIVFDALVRSIGSLQFNFFLSFTILSITEFPSILIVAFVLDKTGRRMLIIIVSIVCCICNILIPFVNGGLVSVIFAVIARFCVNIACNTCMQWAPEMLPTSVRGSGAAFVHICGYIATVISPFVAYLDVVSPRLPPLVIGCVAGLMACIGLVLPETANKEIPHTFEDAEDLMRKHKLWEISCGVMTNNKKQDGQINTTFEME